MKTFLQMFATSVAFTLLAVIVGMFVFGIALLFIGVWLPGLLIIAIASVLIDDLRHTPEQP